MPISPRYELRCDELACHVAGTEATISALTRTLSLSAASLEIANPVPGWQDDDLANTHPSLRDRVAMARALNLAPRVSPADTRPAHVLLDRLKRPVTASATAQPV